MSVQTRVDLVLSCCGVGTGESCCSISWRCVGKDILVEREGRGHMPPPKVDRGCVLTPFRELPSDRKDVVLVRKQFLIL